MQSINIILFDDFSLLDAFGPVEVFRCLEKYFQIDFYSYAGGQVNTIQNLHIQTKPFSAIALHDILLIPGGAGVRSLLQQEDYIAALRNLAIASKQVLAVCTGSVLLAKTGLLAEHQATTNKMAFSWVQNLAPEENWQPKARWCVDGKFYTSSGITAGIDMALGFVHDTIAPQAAQKIATTLEHVWNDNKDNDPFAISI